MSLKKCCDPFSLTKHDSNWVSSVEVEEVSTQFLDEYNEFIPVKLNKDSLLCKNCKIRIERMASKYKQCCNPLMKNPHRTKCFRVISEDLREKNFLFNDKLPIGEIICTGCRIEITKSCEDNLEIMKACINPFDLDKHDIGLGGRNVTRDFISKFSSYSNHLVLNRKICSSCRVKLGRKKIADTQDEGANLEFGAKDNESVTSSEKQNVSYILNDVPCETDTDISDSENDAHEDFLSEPGFANVSNLMKTKEALGELNNAMVPFKMDQVTKESNLSEVYFLCKKELKKRIDIISKNNMLLSPNVCEDCEDLLASA